LWYLWSKKYGVKTLAVDIDGTIVTASPSRPDDFDVTKFGEVLPGAVETLEDLRRDGWFILLYSCRGNPSSNQGWTAPALKTNIAMWADEAGVPYDDVWVGEGKPQANAYLDDKNVEFNGDWSKIKGRLVSYAEDI
jgi:hydroxymethylpyrimidine pyrophosphatase-like HAD family hydrolase